MDNDFKIISIFHNPIPPIVSNSILHETRSNLSGYFVYKLVDQGNEDTITFITTSNARLIITPKGIDLESKYVLPDQDNRNKIKMIISSFVFSGVLLIGIIIYLIIRLVKKDRKIEDLENDLSKEHDNNVNYKILKDADKIEDILFEKLKKVRGEFSPRVDAITFLKSNNIFELKDYTLFGYWVTNDNEFRARIISLFDRLYHSIRTGVNKPILILVCSERGSGKTSLCKQIADKILPGSSIIEFKTSYHQNDVKKGFDGHLIQIFDCQSDNNYTFVLLHEVDFKCGDSYLFPELIGPCSGENIKISNETKMLNNVIYFFEGFIYQSIKEFENKSKVTDPQIRMKDFLDLIPIENRIDIPNFKDNWKEKLVRSLSIFKQESSEIKSIEKTVLFYLALTEFSHMSQLKNLINRTCKKRTAYSTIIQWRDLEVPEEMKQNFIKKYPEITELYGTGNLELR